jgi:hypothetical protein
MPKPTQLAVLRALEVTSDGTPVEGQEANESGSLTG